MCSSLIQSHIYLILKCCKSRVLHHRALLKLKDEGEMKLFLVHI